MKIIQVENLNIPDIIAAVRDGATIVYPTETCYGLGCDARNAEAVEKIIKIKQRREAPPSSASSGLRRASKPFLVVVPDVAMAMEYLVWSPQLDEIANKYWPGALTVVGTWNIEQRTALVSGVVAKDRTIALRVTSHPVAAALARALGRPLISTSANISGKEPSYSAEEVIKMFENQSDQPDILLDYGVLPQNPPTTIVRVVDGKVEVVRQGEVMVG